MRALTILSLIMVFFTIGCNQNQTADQEPPKADKEYNFVKTYEGEINNIGITMKIMSNASKISGSYYYDKIKEEVTLKGEIDNDTIEMDGFDQNGNLIDKFMGVIASKDASKIEGTWSKPSGKKSDDFYLLESNKNFEGSLEEKGEVMNAYIDPETIDDTEKDTIYPSMKRDETGKIMFDRDNLGNYEGKRIMEDGFWDEQKVKSAMMIVTEGKLSQSQLKTFRGMESEPLIRTGDVLHGKVFLIDKGTWHLFYDLLYDRIAIVSTDESIVADNQITKNLKSLIQQMYPSKRFSSQKTTSTNSLRQELKEREKEEATENLKFEYTIKEKFVRKGVLQQKKSRGYFFDIEFSNFARMANYKNPVVEITFKNTKGEVVSKKEIMINKTIHAGKKVTYGEKIQIPKSQKTFHKVTLKKVTTL